MKKYTLILIIICILTIQTFKLLTPLTVFADVWYQDLDGDGMPDNFTQEQKNAYKDIKNGKITPSTAGQLSNADFWVKLGVGKVLDTSSKYFNDALNTYKSYESGYYNKYGNLPFTSCLSLTGENMGKCTRDYEIWKNSFNNNDSGYRNYYKNGTTNNSFSTFNQGDTFNTRIVDSYNKTITYYNSNTNNYVTNKYNSYYYDLHTESYVYNTSFNESYVITNNIDNTSVTIINSQGNQLNKYYFQLPDGSNSYNMVKENINGYLLDFNIKNYDNMTDDGSMVGLYHFEGNKNNSSYNKDYPLSFYQESINYLSDNNKFDNYIMFGGYNTMSIPFDNTIKSIDFRFKPIMGNNKFQLNLNSYPLFSRWKEIKDTTTYTTKTTTQNQLVYVAGRYVGFQYIDEPCPSGARFLGYRSAGQITHSNGTTGTIKERICEVTLTTTQQVPVTKSTVEVKDGAMSYKVFWGGWNHLAINNIIGSKGDIYLNGEFIVNYDFKEGNIFTKWSGDGSMGIDEVRISTKNNYVGNFTVNTTPYDSDIVYILPETEVNNTILIKSRIKVNSTQYGGQRKSNPKLGDIFVSVNESNYVTSLQQFNGSDWIYIDSAIYNINLKKWVSFVGHSIIKDNSIVNEENNNINNKILNNNLDYKFFDNWFTKILEKLDNLKVNTINIAGTNVWDFLIKIIDSISSGITNAFGGISELLVKLFIPQDGFLDDIQFDYKGKFGILYFPFEITAILFNSLFIPKDTLTVIQSSNIDLMGITLIPAFNFDFNDLLQDKNLLFVYNTYLVVVDGVIYFGLYNLIKRKTLNFLDNK